jgi:hypothetical protein
MGKDLLPEIYTKGQAPELIQRIAVPQWMSMERR